MAIKIYKQERLDGLTEQIRKNNKLCFASAIHDLSNIDSLKNIKDRFLDKVKASKETQPDLYYLRTILVSVGWNANDDVFGVQPTWAARHSPEDKPFNFEHNSKDIIGHITSSYVVDDKYNIIDDDTAEDEVPNFFHILTGAVIYQSQDSPEDHDRIQKIISEIQKGDWFVSMEALFHDFCYALKNKSTGEHVILDRNKETAYLTRHLKIFGGTGEYKDYKVGRYLKDIVFCGKGLVRNPANKDSVILLEGEKFENVPVVANLKMEEKKCEKNINLENPVYVVADNNITKGNQMTIEQLQAELKAAEASVTALTLERDNAKAEVNKLTETNKTLSADFDKVKADNILLTERATSAEKTVESLKTENSGLTEKVNKFVAEKTEQSRVDLLVDRGATKEKASEVVKLLHKLSDEEFTAFADKHEFKVEKVEKVEKTTPEQLLNVTLEKAEGGLPMAITNISTAGYENAQNELFNLLHNK